MNPPAPRRPTAIGAAAWSTGGAAVNQLVQFALFVLLARMLSTTEFGLAALGVLFIQLGSSFLGGGLTSAVVRKPELLPIEADTAYVLCLVQGFGGCLLIALAAPVAAAMMKAPALAPIMAVLSLSLVLSGFGRMQIARLQRDLRFRALAVRQTMASLCGGIGGLVLAFAGAGVWALVARTLIAAAVSTLLVWRLSGWRPRLRVDLRASAVLLRSAAHLTAAQAVSQTGRRAGELAAGVLISPAATALLRVAGQCFNLVAQLTLGPLATVSLALLARAQGDAPTRRAAYEDLSRIAALITFPAFLGMMAVADVAIPLVFGQKWAISGLLMAPLCAIVLPLQFNLIFSAGVTAAGRGDLLWRWSLLQSACGLALAVVGARWGLTGIVASQVLAAYVTLPLGVRWLQRELGVPVGALVSPALPALLASGLMALAVATLEALLKPHLGGWPLLATLIGVGTAVYVAVLAIVEPRALEELRAASRAGRGGAQPAVEASGLP